MTAASDLQPRSRRDVRVGRTARTPNSRWSRRRGVTGVFAGFAALVCAGAYVAPLGAAVGGAQAAEVDAVSLYAASADDTQSYITASDGVTETPGGAMFDRSGISYSVYVTPEPEPEPEPVQPDTSATGSAAVASPLYTGGGSKSEWLSAAGIAESNWSYVDYIASRESGWNPNATNSSSGACGLIQAYPCSKVPGNGYNPVDNLRWANGYAVGRYGSWEAAYAFWTTNHWW